MVQSHQGIVHKICGIYTDSAFDHQDLYQEIIIQLWKSFAGFRGESKYSTWIYRIALNTAISDLRKKKRRIRLVLSDDIPAQQADLNPGPEKEEQLRQLYNAIGQLGDIDKALVMLYLEDRSYEEMEEILGINQNNLRVKMNRIKEKLRKLTKAVEYGIG